MNPRVNFTRVTRWWQPCRRRSRVVLLAGLVAMSCLTPVSAALAIAVDTAEPQEQGLLCRAAIRAAEAGRELPPMLLSAIARVESGRSDPVSGRMHPWPWSINVEGRSFVFATKADAINRVRQLQSQGVRSIDVGCMQINLMYHPDAFHDLEEAFDPLANARYAVEFLTSLKEKTGSWEQAAAAYHSFTPDVGSAYRVRVQAALVEEAKASGSLGALPSLSPTPGVGAWMAAPGTVLRSLPAGQGSFAMLGGHFAGGMLPPPARIISGGGVIGGGAMQGLGLEAYRMRPVAMLSNRAEMAFGSGVAAAR